MTTVAELTEVCERQCARNLGWFTTLGGWVADEPDPVRQRCFAEAAHRHAWHAQLWAERRPRIPPELVPEPPEPDVVAVDGDRAEAYRAAIDTIRAELADLRAATDPDLDPSTHRVAALVDADLAELRSRLG